MRWPEVELTEPKAKVAPSRSARVFARDPAATMIFEWKRASSSRCTRGMAVPVRRRACTKVKPPYHTRSSLPVASPSTVAA
jgi:hypothetical protein